jgi:uncharacterized protein involved in type VI secretion and phage assembly
MSSPWLEHLLGVDEPAGGFTISTGTVTNAFDLIAEGRVQVKVHARPSFEPWARLVAIGGSSERGFLWVPQNDDEVLVAFAQDDLSTAFVLGGLWSTENRPPLSDPLEFKTKRVLKTGLEEGLGHSVEFDDAEQSITITTSTEQSITLDPMKIELTNAAGTVSIKLDNASQQISVEAVKSISLKALSIELEAADISIKGSASVSVTSQGEVAVNGTIVRLN